MSRPTTRSTSSSSPNVDNASPPTVTSPTTDQRLASVDQRLTSILELLVQPDHRITTILTQLEQRLDERLIAANNRLTSIEDDYKTLSNTVHHSFDSSPPPILSAPPMTPAEIETLIDSKFHATYQTTVDSFSSLSATVATLHLQHSTSPTTPLSTPRPTGFFQKESKDLHVSKLVKLLELEVLHSDSLQDLEIFFDSILSHFNTVALTNDLYPRYCDLPPTFDIYRQLCQLDRTIRPSPMDQAQGLANYKSFGTGLCRFLLNPCTFT
jgi:hypothetical protein